MKKIRCGNDGRDVVVVGVDDDDDYFDWNHIVCRWLPRHAAGGGDGYE